MKPLILPIAVFSFAFSYEEASVVLYLRKIGFPPLPTAAHVFYLELGREAATIFVLLVLAWSLGRPKRELQLRSFFLTFGLWDIGYYAWLYALSRYPSLSSTDLLFSLPVPWIGPVWAAVSFAAILAMAGLFGLHHQRGVFFFFGMLAGFCSFVGQAIGITGSYPVWLFLLAAMLGLVGIKWPMRAPIPAETPLQQPD